MDDEDLLDDEERRVLELLQNAALHDYPNPDRIGCPGDAFLWQLAFDRNSIPLSDERLRHVPQCSPCFRALTAFQETASRSGPKQ